MSRYKPEYKIVKKGSCLQPKIISQETFDKFKKSGIIRSFDWQQLPPPVEPPPIESPEDGGSSLDSGSLNSTDLSSDESGGSSEKKTTKKKK